MTLYRQLLVNDGRMAPVDAGEVIVEMLKKPVHADDGVMLLAHIPKSFTRIRWNGQEFVPVNGPTLAQMHLDGQISDAPDDFKDVLREIETLRGVVNKHPARSVRSTAKRTDHISHSS